MLSFSARAPCGITSTSISCTFIVLISIHQDSAERGLLSEVLPASPSLRWTIDTACSTLETPQSRVLSRSYRHLQHQHSAQLKAHSRCSGNVCQISEGFLPQLRGSFPPHCLPLVSFSSTFIVQILFHKDFLTLLPRPRGIFNHSYTWPPRSCFFMLLKHLSPCLFANFLHFCLLAAFELFQGKEGGSPTSLHTQHFA